jgi:hypothetical protein
LIVVAIAALLMAGREASREVRHPPNSFGEVRHREVRPFPCEIGPNAQDEMDMVAHDGITADIDREDRGKLLEPLADPFLAVLIIMSGFDIEPTKERAANASRDAMIDPKPRRQTRSESAGKLASWTSPRWQKHDRAADKVCARSVVV